MSKNKTIPVQATISNRFKLANTGTTKHKGKFIKSLAFKKTDNGGLLMKVNGETWDMCIDTVDLLCDLGLKIKIE